VCRLFIRLYFIGGGVLPKHRQSTVSGVCLSLCGICTRLDLSTRECCVEHVHATCDVIDRALEGSI
jgi:hypothetical protein